MALQGFEDLYRLYSTIGGSPALDEVLGALTKRQQELAGAAQGSLERFRGAIEEPLPAATPDVAPLAAAGMLLSGALAPMISRAPLPGPAPSEVLFQQQALNRRDLLQRRLTNLQALLGQYERQEQAAMEMGNDAARTAALTRKEQILKNMEVAGRLLQEEQQQRGAMARTEREQAGADARAQLAAETDITTAGMRLAGDLIGKGIIYDWRTGQMARIPETTNRADFEKSVQDAFSDFPAAVKASNDKVARGMLRNRIASISAPPDMTFEQYRQWLAGLRDKDGRKLFNPKNKDERGIFNLAVWMNYPESLAAEAGKTITAKSVGATEEADLGFAPHAAELQQEAQRVAQELEAGGPLSEARRQQARKRIAEIRAELRANGYALLIRVRQGAPQVEGAEVRP